MKLTSSHPSAHARVIVVTLVDSNVILDVVGEDPEWFDWSAAVLARAAERGRFGFWVRRSRFQVLGSWFAVGVQQFSEPEP
jgi:hypothetical protein